MKILGLRAKIIGLLILLITIVMGWMTYQTVQVQVDNRIQEFTEQARAVGNVFGLNYARSLLTKSPLTSQDQLSTRLWEQSSERAVFLIAYGVDGARLHKQPEQIPVRYRPLPEIEPSEVKQFLRSDQSMLRRWDRHRNLFEVLVPIRHHDNRIGVVRLGLDTRAIEQARWEILTQNLRVTGYFWIAVALIGMLATARIIRPLESLVEVTRRLGEGDLEVRSEVKTHDEIGELGDHFNEMAERIQKRIREREQSLAQLQAIQRVGTTLNESTDPDVFFPVLYEAIHTLYGIESFVPLIWDGDIYHAPYSRPELETPLFIPPESDVIDAVDRDPEPFPVEPGEDWPPALQSMTWAYPLKTGYYLNGVLFMELEEEPDEEELEWMKIWGTQVSQAIRGMVLNRQVLKFRNRPVEAMRERIDWLIGEDMDCFSRLTIPDFLEKREQEGLFYGEDFHEQLSNALDSLEFPVQATQITQNQFVLAAEGLSSFEKTDVETHLREQVDFEFQCDWLDLDDPSENNVEEFLLT